MGQTITPSLRERLWAERVYAQTPYTLKECVEVAHIAVVVGIPADSVVKIAEFYYSKCSTTLYSIMWKLLHDWSNDQLSRVLLEYDSLIDWNDQVLN